MEPLRTTSSMPWQWQSFEEGMTMADKKATREAYGDALVEFGAAYKNLVVLDADLAEATKTCKFKAAYPDRFFDCNSCIYFFRIRR